MMSFTELLGFAVLSSPLWLIVILLSICIWLAARLSRHLGPGFIRLVGSVGIFLLLFALPFADEIAGRIYLNYLCANEAGVKVYRTVDLSAEYWDEAGKPKFLKGSGSIDNSVLNGYESSFDNVDVNRALGVRKFTFRYFDKSNYQVLGEYVNFSFMGGWIERNFSPAPGAGDSCELEQLGDSNKKLLSVFRRNAN